MVADYCEQCGQHHLGRYAGSVAVADVAWIRYRERNAEWWNAADSSSRRLV